MRRLAFLALAAAITIAALMLGSHHEYASTSPVRDETADRHPRHPTAPPSPPDLRRAAADFIEAFLNLEAGAADRPTRIVIRRNASHHLARILLTDAPTAKSHPAPPPPVSLHVTRLPHRPDLALLTGTAIRFSDPEPFAFLFARRDGRWLAIAPAE